MDSSYGLYCNFYSPHTSNQLNFSCGHVICSLCLSKLIFLEYFQDIANNDSVQFNCKCSNGNLTISLKQVIEVIKTIDQHQSHVCQKHHNVAKLYCMKCTEWLCEVCINLHNELFVNHHLTEDQPKEIERCEKHQKGYKELFCKDCNVEICPSCTFKGSSHFNHNYEQIEEVAEKLRGEINQKYISIDDCFKSLDQVGTKFKDKLNKTIDITLSKIDALIQFFEDYRGKFIGFSQKILERAELTTEITKLLYGYFYTDLKKNLTTLDISLLKTLSPAQWDFSDLNFKNFTTISMEIDKIKSRVEIIEEIARSSENEFNLEFFKQLKFECVTTVPAHQNTVWIAIQLNDGKIATASFDYSIVIWDSTSFKKISTLNEHKGFVYGLIELQDGRLASSSHDSSIKIWEHLITYVCKWTLTGHTTSVNSIIELKNQQLASGSDDKTIKIWKRNDFGGYNCIETITGHSGSIYCLCHLNGDKFASGSNDKTIRIWKASDFQCIQCLTEHTERIRAIIQLKDGRLASGSGDNTIKIWAVDRNGNFSFAQSLSGHTGVVGALVQLKDGRLVSGCDDKTIRIWNPLDKFSCDKILIGHDSGVWTVLQLKDSRLLTGSTDKTIRIWG